MPFKKGNIPWNINKPCSEERKRKISKATKGEKCYWFGKHLSEEHRRKISKATKGRHHSPNTEFKKGIIPWNTGLTKENNERLMRNSEAMMGGKNPNYGKHPSLENLKKMSERMIGEKNPFYGKTHSLESSRKMSENQMGEKNHQWLGGISFEPYGVEFTKTLKHLIRERDNFTCQLCGIYQEDLEKKLAIHHINYNKKNNDPINLIALCQPCHSKTNSNREHWTELFTCISRQKI